MEGLIAVFIVILFGIIAQLFLTNKGHREKITELKEELREKEKSENDDGTEVVIEFTNGERRRVVGVRKLQYEDSGIVLRSSNGNIIANVNPKSVRIICTEESFDESETEEAIE